MRTKRTTSFTTCAALIVLFAATALSQTIPAFPGAEGYGKWAKGGRGGDVIYVTTLEDNNDPGSLRYALEQSGPRTVVFRTGGTIELESGIWISNPYLTIAGQTAPGDGICVRLADNTDDCSPMIFRTHDIVIRHIRMRSGPVYVDPDDTNTGNNNIRFKPDAYDCIVDHVSLSWAVDQNMGIWGESTENITIQNCIVSEGLMTGHAKGDGHSKGILIGGGADNITIYRNIFAHNNDRNPLINTDNVSGVTVDLQVVNNVVYNWQNYATLVKASVSSAIVRANVVGNYYKQGANSNTRDLNIGTEGDVQLYVKDNIGPNRPDNSYDDWAIVGHRDGGETHYPAPTQYQATTPHSMPALPTMSVFDAYDDVLATAGATKQGRDDVDIRIVDDVTNGTGSLIDDPFEVGGWPDLASGTPYPDSDEDGMADAWEDGKGLNPTTADHNGFDLHSEYTNLEIYLQYLAGDIASEPAPPTVAFTRPTETVVTEPADLGVVAEATAPGGSIDNVKLYLDNTFVRQENNAPYEWGTASAAAADSALLSLTEGTYTLRVVATDTNGKTASDTMEITVEPGVVGAGAQALLSSPVNAEQMVQVLDLLGRRVFREAVPCKRRGDSHAMSARTRGVFIVRSRRDKTPSTRIVVLDGGN